MENNHRLLCKKNDVFPFYRSVGSVLSGDDFGIVVQHESNQCADCISDHPLLPIASNCALYRTVRQEKTAKKKNNEISTQKKSPEFREIFYYTNDTQNLGILKGFLMGLEGIKLIISALLMQ